MQFKDDPSPVYSWTVNSYNDSFQSPEKSHRQNVIHEILSTEESYYNDLLLVKDVNKLANFFKTLFIIIISQNLGSPSIHSIGSTHTTLLFFR